MRLIPWSVVVSLLAAGVVAAPAGAATAPKPVPPAVHEVTVPAVAGTGKPSPSATAVTGPSTVAAAGDPVVAARRVENTDFDLAGVTFDVAPPTGTAVEVRVHTASGWAPWTALALDGDGPDPGSVDAEHARPGTEPVAAVGSDGLDVRVSTPDGSVPGGIRASLVDGGVLPADAPALLAASPPGSGVDQPAIISRAAWGADESLRSCDPVRLPGFKAVLVHHTVTSNSYTAAEAPALMRSIYAFHTQGRGWCDVGYQLLVDRFGRVYEGRKGSTASFVQGAQAGGFNEETTGVSVIGDYTSIPFSAATRSAVARVVAWEADRSHFDPATSMTLHSAGNSRYAAGQSTVLPRTIGHRDLSLTGCPGDVAYAQQLPTIKRDASAAWQTGQWRPLPPRVVPETYYRPASSVFTLAGRGFGAGIGAWTASLKATDIERAYPSVGTMRSVLVLGRSGGGGTGTYGGTVSSIRVLGRAGTVTVSGESFRTRLDLKSAWFTVTSAPARSQPLSPRDVTGDGLPDVVVPEGSRLRTLSYTGSMSFETRTILTGGYVGLRAPAAVGPWGPDSRGDVMAIGTDGSAWYYPGAGASGLNAGRYRIATGWGAVNLIIPVGDFDGDGHTDVATRMSDGSLVLRSGDGAGHVLASRTIGASGWNGLGQITTGDFDGDGLPDLVTVRSRDGALVLYPGDGTGRFQSARVIGAWGWNGFSDVRGVGDLTGDGRDDILVRRSGTGSLLVYKVIGSAQVLVTLPAGTASPSIHWGQ